MAIGDVTFRTKQEGSQIPVKPDSADLGPHTASESQVEVPFTDYIQEHGHPLAVDYYQLGDTWEDPQGGFYKEVSIIDGYMKDLINRGEIANTTEAVKERIKQIEKINNLDKSQRTTMKIATVSAYIKFLQETDGVKNSMKKYGNY